ncbi:hypothetical protein DsansV1_C09g0091641 [Dioscorea sansibarensis]
MRFSTVICISPLDMNNDISAQGLIQVTSNLLPEGTQACACRGDSLGEVVNLHHTFAAVLLHPSSVTHQDTEELKEATRYKRKQILSQKLELSMLAL